MNSMNYITLSLRLVILLQTVILMNNKFKEVANN